MLPAGAYITLEHEYILILKKGEKRSFLTDTEKKIKGVLHIHTLIEKGIS